MISISHFQELKENFGGHSSWAIWSPKLNEKPKSNIGDLSLFDEENIKNTSKILNPKIVLLGLNLSRPLDKKLRNFHDPGPHSQDFKLRFALDGTALSGAYMTDIIKDYIEADSSKLSHITSTSNIDFHIKTFRDEISMLSKKPKIFCLGRQVFKIVSKHFRNDEFSEVVQIMHYSARINQEKYKIKISESIPSP